MPRCCLGPQAHCHALGALLASAGTVPLLSCAEARRIATNIAKLPERLRR